MSVRPNPLGDLFRARRRRSKVGFKQLHAATGAEPETMRRWETGGIYDPPLRGALFYAREVGITLDELAEAALGEPWERSGAPDAETSVAPGFASRGSAIPGSADGIAARAAGQAKRKRPSRRNPSAPSQDG